MLILLLVLVSVAVILVLIEFIYPLFAGRKDASSLPRAVPPEAGRVFSPSVSLPPAPDKDAAARAKSRENDLVDQLFKQKNKIDSLLEKVNEYETKNQELTAEAAHLRQTEIAGRQELKKFKTDYDKIKEELEINQKRIVDLDKELSKRKQLSGTMEEELERLRDENRQLKDDIDYERHHE